MPLLAVLQCNSKPQDPKSTYPKMGKALNASGRHIAFNMCEWGLENPWEWVRVLPLA